jgi:hypothetical protein
MVQSTSLNLAYVKTGAKSTMSCLELTFGEASILKISTLSMSLGS